MEEAEASPPRLTPDEEEEKENEVLIKYVKEKENLRAELAIKEKEIQKYKAKVYDMSEKMKSLEEELKAANNTNKSRQLPLSGDSSKVPSNKLGVVRPSTARRSPMVQRAKSAKARGQHKSSKKPSRHTSVSSTPPVERNTPPSDGDMAKFTSALQRVALYDKVAEQLPELKLSVLIKSEKFFNESDINNDGTIDENELEQLLMKQGHLYTDKEIKEIMSQIDVDKTGTIDIMEYLTVMERVQQRKRVNLPPSLTKNTSSSVCVIQ